MPFGTTSRQRSDLKDDMDKKTNMWKSGTKYRGARSDTLMSMLDSTQATNQYAARIEKFGGRLDGGKVVKRPGIVKFQALNDDGTPADEGVLNFGGRTFKSDANGRFTILDSKYLEDEARLAEEIDRYVNETTRFCLANDETCAAILTNGDVELLGTILGSHDSNGAGFTFAQIRAAVGDAVAQELVDVVGSLPKEIRQASSMPSLLAAIDSSSNLYGLGISKLKACVRVVAPILENEQKGMKESKLDEADI